MTEIKKGYKESEIGVIPEGWEVVKVGDILNVQTGKMNAQDQVENGKYPFFTRSVDVQKIDTFAYDTEALFIAGEGNFKVKYYNGKFNLHQRTYMLTSIKNANIKFLLNAIQPKVNKLISTSVGSTVQSLRKPLIEDLKIPFPSLKEQEKIANILSTADEKIDAITSQIQKAQTLKKGLLQKLLSEGIGHSEFKDSELGKIPENWEVYQLNTILEYVKKTLKMKDEKRYELITVKRRFGGVKSRGIFLGKDILVKNQFYLFENNFLISKRQISHGACGLVPKKLDGAIVSNEYNIFTSNSKLLDLVFFNYYVQTPKLHLSFYKHSHGVHIEKMLFNTESWLRQKLVFPPLKEQKQITDILSTADEKLELLRAKKEKHEELKKGLLQKLLSGEVRV